MDGFQGSVKSVMKAAEARRLRGITGPVSTILTVQPGYETAIETALGFALQNIVVEDETAAKAAMAYLKETKGGRATFLPLDTVRPAGFDARSLPQEAVCASSLVQAEARYANIVSNLLGRIVVVDDINTASRVARALGLPQPRGHAGRAGHQRGRLVHRRQRVALGRAVQPQAGAGRASQKAGRP